MSELTKTTLYLREADYRRLKAIARRQKRSAAELVRTAVAEFAERQEGRRLPKSIGSGRSGRDDLSERAEEFLRNMGKA
jgi:hypothetical protein